MLFANVCILPVLVACCADWFFSSVAPNILRSSCLAMPFKSNMAKLAPIQSMEDLDLLAYVSDDSVSLDEKIKAARSAHMHGIYL